MIEVNVNGVMRKPPEVASFVNGVWRKHNKVFNNINGVWRNVYTKENKPFVVKGFILRYHLNVFKKHPDYPKLKYNRKIPYNFQLSGENTNEMDLTNKSVVFEYNNQAYEEEGIIMYEGHLYVRTLADEEIDIGKIPTDDRLRGHKITITCETVDENYGYYLAGWNSIFSSKQFLHPKGKPNVINQYHDRQNDLFVSPDWKRNSDYNITCDIGIARDMTSPENNMIGTRGHLTHTIYDIKFDNEPQPFIIEIE